MDLDSRSSGFEDAHQFRIVAASQVLDVRDVSNMTTGIHSGRGNEGANSNVAGKNMYYLFV